MENREISALQTGLAGHFIKRRLTEFGASAALSDISVPARGLSPNAWNSDGIVNPCRGRRGVRRDEIKIQAACAHALLVFGQMEDMFWSSKRETRWVVRRIPMVPQGRSRRRWCHEFPRYPPLSPSLLHSTVCVCVCVCKKTPLTRWFAIHHNRGLFSECRGGRGTNFPHVRRGENAE